VNVVLADDADPTFAEQRAADNMRAELQMLPQPHATKVSTQMSACL